MSDVSPLYRVFILFFCPRSPSRSFEVFKLSLNRCLVMEIINGLIINDLIINGLISSDSTGEDRRATGDDQRSRFFKDPSVLFSFPVFADRRFPPTSETRVRTDSPPCKQRAEVQLVSPGSKAIIPRYVEGLRGTEHYEEK